MQVARAYYDGDRDGSGDPRGYATRRERLAAVDTLTGGPGLTAADATGVDTERSYTIVGGR